MNNKTHLSVAICAALSTPFSDAVADEASASISHLETITVVASRTDMPMAHLAASVDVINEADIAALNQPSVADILRVSTGIGVSNSGGLGKNTAIRIRGEESYRTQLYLDGVSLADPSAPQVAPVFDDILSSQIKRIEVLRGAQGLVYGADAGGVISLFTDTGSQSDGISGSVSLEAGKFDTQRAAADISASGEEGSIFFSAHDLSTDGFNALKSDTSGETDGYDNTTAHFNGRINLTNNVSARLVVRDTRAENQYDNCFDGQTFTFTNDCLSEADNQIARASVTADFDTHQHTVGIASTDISRDFFSNGNEAFTSEGKILKADYVGRIETGSTQWVLGADIERQAIPASESRATADTEQRRYQRGVFVEQYTEAADNLHLSAGVRFDSNDTFGDHTSYRVGAVYLYPVTGGTLKFKSALGTGFRAPSLFEQSYNDGPFAFGAAAGLQLKEETSQGLDVGVVYAGHKGFTAELTLFRQDIEDEIVFDNIGFQGYLQADGRSRSEGVEAQLSLPVSDTVNIDANYTYNEATDLNDAPRIRRPRHTANVGVTTEWLNSRLHLNGFIRAVKDVEGIGGETLDDSVVANLTASYEMSASLKLHGRIDNLFDREYQEVIGYNSAGRSAYVGVTFTY